MGVAGAEEALVPHWVTDPAGAAQSPFPFSRICTFYRVKGHHLGGDITVPQRRHSLSQEGTPFQYLMF